MKDLPRVASLLLEELANNSMISDADILELNTLLTQTQHAHNSIDKFLLKNIFTQSSLNSKKLNHLDQKLYDAVKEKIKSIPEDRKYILFLYESILIDLGELLTDSEYKNFIQYQKNKSPTLETSIQRFKSKYSLISPWLRIILENNSEDFLKKMDIFNQENLVFLKKLLNNFSKSQNFTELPIIKFITRVDLDLEKAKKEIDNLSFQIAPQPDPLYTPPEKLPVPVTDWEPVDEEIIEDGIPLTKDQLFPLPDPNYTPPKTLPKAVDKWQSPSDL